MALKQKMNEFSIKSVENLKKHVIELKRELMNLRFKKVSGEIKETHSFKKLRREIAQVKTVLTLKTREKLEK